MASVARKIRIKISERGKYIHIVRETGDNWFICFDITDDFKGDCNSCFNPK